MTWSRAPSAWRQDVKGGVSSRLETPPLETGFRIDQARSKRSRFITLSHAATKSFANFSFASAEA